MCSFRDYQLFGELFINRRDVYARQYAHNNSHGYVCVKEELSPELVVEHLNGDRTLGIYALSRKSTAKWVVIDADTTVKSQLEQIIEEAKKLGLPKPVIEFSGRRGYHFWWFFEKPVSGWKAKSLGEAITREQEVFPKQSEVSEDTTRPGSLVKAPLGIHRLSGKWSTFIDSEFRVVNDPWGVLRSIEKVDIRKYHSVINSRKSKRKTEEVILSGPNILRPCIAEALKEGTTEGYRNETGHLIACEMYRLGVGKEQTKGVLACWNLRNKPRISKRELQVIIDNAYSGKGYSYSCSPDGRLRRFLNCIGQEKCHFFKSLKKAARENRVDRKSL